MNWRAIRAIVRKDLKVVMQNKGVMIPIVVLPLVFLVVLPGLAALAPLLEGVSGEAMADTKAFLENMPAGLREAVAGYDEVQTMVILWLVYLFAPMYLILPLMVSSVIAADSFAGEKERKTLEALLYTPTSDRELLVAKMLSATVPAVAIAWAGFLLYSVTANLAGWSTMGRVFFPNLMWVFLALWVAPAVAGLGLGITVLVSAKAETFQEAYQLGGVVVLPILLLLVGQLTGVIYFSSWMVLALGLFFWVIDAALLYVAARRFRRSELAVGM
jgi:ABC-2 type transport system permease protein